MVVVMRESVMELKVIAACCRRPSIYAGCQALHRVVSVRTARTESRGACRSIALDMRTVDGIRREMAVINPKRRAKLMMASLINFTVVIFYSQRNTFMATA